MLSRQRLAGVRRSHGATLVDLGTVLKASDVVTLHVVLTAKTWGVIGTRELRMMKLTAFLINTSRGEAIQEQWTAGVALDVFKEDPLSLDSLLRALVAEYVILTPHNISHSADSRNGNLRLALEGLLTGLKGEVPEHVVNLGAIPLWRERLRQAEGDSAGLRA